jgi:hypothetical protein
VEFVMSRGKILLHVIGINFDNTVGKAAIE